MWGKLLCFRFVLLIAASVLGGGCAAGQASQITNASILIDARDLTGDPVHISIRGLDDSNRSILVLFDGMIKLDATYPISVSVPRMATMVLEVRNVSNYSRFTNIATLPVSLLQGEDQLLVTIEGRDPDSHSYRTADDKAIKPEFISIKGIMVRVVGGDYAVF